MSCAKEVCAGHFTVVILSDDDRLIANLQQALTPAGFSAIIGIKPSDEAIARERSSEGQVRSIYVIDHIAGGVSYPDILFAFQNQGVFVDSVLLVPWAEFHLISQSKSLGVHEIIPRSEELHLFLPAVINQLACRLLMEESLQVCRAGTSDDNTVKDQLAGDPVKMCVQEEIRKEGLVSSDADRMKLIEERVKLLDFNTGEMISRHSPERELIYISPSCVCILGYTREEMSGTSIFQYIHPEDAELIDEGFRKAVKQQARNFSEICRVRRKDGQFIWLDVVNRIIYDENSGDVLEVVSIARDVTAHREKEELLKAKEVAERANQAKSAFLANVSHEIRNPLGAMIGMARTLEKTKLDDEQQRYLRSILISSGNLLTILNDILEYSKLVDDKMDVVCRPFPVRDSLVDLVRMFREQAEERGNTIRLQIGPDVPPVLNGDREKIEQTVSNLLSNANKFTSEGEVTLYVQFDKTDPGYEKWLFTVADTGIGVPETEIPMLFDPFYQLDDSSNKEYQGIGLGLSISRGLVEIMGGKLTFESTPGKGSYASFSIPVVQYLDQEKKEQEVVTPEQQQPLKILIAEDDAINQMYLAGLLRENGWKVDTAYNGLAALELYQKEQYDLILMDGQMPRMDGFEATEKIRELEKDMGRKTPIIAITGYATPGDRERFLDSGMDHYLSKPVNERELLAAVRNLTMGKNSS